MMKTQWQHRRSLSDSVHWHRPRSQATPTSQATIGNSSAAGTILIPADHHNHQSPSTYLHHHRLGSPNIVNSSSRFALHEPLLLLEQTISDPVAPVCLTTADVSSLLSRIAQLEAELAAVSDDRKTLATTTESGVIVEKSQCACATQCSRHLRIDQLPVIKRFIACAEEAVLREEDPEDCLAELVEHMLLNDRLGPWAHLRIRVTNMKNPIVHVPRKQQQYVAAINMKIRERKEVRNWKKVSDFWKSFVRGKSCVISPGPPEEETMNLIVTPSPSELSDVEMPVSSERTQSVEALFDRLKIRVELRVKEKDGFGSGMKEGLRSELTTSLNPIPSNCNRLSPSNISARTLVEEDDDDVLLGSLYPTASASRKQTSEDSTVTGERVPPGTSSRSFPASPCQNTDSPDYGPMRGLPKQTPQKSGAGCAGFTTTLIDCHVPESLRNAKKTIGPLFSKRLAGSSKNSPIVLSSSRDEAFNATNENENEQQIKPVSKVPEALPRGSLKPLITGNRYTNLGAGR